MGRARLYLLLLFNFPQQSTHAACQRPLALQVINEANSSMKCLAMNWYGQQYLLQTVFKTGSSSTCPQSCLGHLVFTQEWPFLDQPRRVLAHQSYRKVIRGDPEQQISAQQPDNFKYMFGGQRSPNCSGCPGLSFDACGSPML